MLLNSLTCNQDSHLVERFLVLRSRVRTVLLEVRFTCMSVTSRNPNKIKQRQL